MSLDFNLTNIKDFQEVCYQPADDEPGSVQLTRVTNNIIWACMGVGIGSITEQNYTEFALRVAMWDEVHNIPKESRLTIEDVKRHIGLTTNVFPKETDAQFMRKLRRSFTERNNNVRT